MRHILLCCLVLTGCTALMSQAPRYEGLTRPVPPSTAYTCAIQAMARMGGTITQADAASCMLSAQIHNAVILNVVALPDPVGSRVDITGAVLPNKMAIGEFTEVHDYIALLREEVLCQPKPH